MFSKYGIVTQIINYKFLDRFGAIFALNKLKIALHYVLLRKVELTQFDVKWAISPNRDYSENIRKYYILVFFLICFLYRYVINIYIGSMLSKYITKTHARLPQFYTRWVSSINVSIIILSIIITCISRNMEWSFKDCKCYSGITKGLESI